MNLTNQSVRKWICNGAFHFRTAVDAERMERQLGVKMHEVVDGRETKKRPIDYMTDAMIIAQYKSGERSFVSGLTEDSVEQKVAEAICGYYARSGWNNPMKRDHE